MNVQQFFRLANQRIAELQQALNQLKTDYSKHDQRTGELQQTREAALTELATVNLPALVPQAIAEVETRTGYGKFRQIDPIEYKQRERVRLSKLIADIQADPKFINRQQLLEPTAGELTLKAQKAKQELDLIQSAIGRYEAEPDFVSLYERGYDTDDYKESIFSFRFYGDWRRGDAIVEKFGVENFAVLRAAYEPLRRSRELYSKDYQDAQAAIEDVRRLIAQFNEAKQRLDNLAHVVLEECQTALREHLAYVDREQLFEWSKGDRIREALVKKIHGLEKQIEYTKTMTSRQMQEESRVLNEAIIKIKRKITKFGRPKNAYVTLNDAEVYAWLADPRQKLSARRERFWRQYDRVAYYDRYDYYDYTRDMLWWDLMTDGRVDGNFIPEVYEYHQQNPNYHWDSSYAEPTPVLTPDYNDIPSGVEVS